jgi:hypothetical protein
MNSQFTWMGTLLVVAAGGAVLYGQPPLRPGAAAGDQPEAASMMTTSIPLQGAARGGELILAEALNRNMRVALIPTRRGESAAVVAARLAQFINDNNPFEWPIPAGTAAVRAEGGTLVGLPGSSLDYVLAGTERGLGIPQPPTSLTCTHETAGHALLLDWDNPPGGYDEIGIVYNWSNFDHRGGDVVAGEATSFAVDLDDRPLNVEDLDIWVIGFRKGLPSGAAAVHVSGSSLQELSGVPFTEGLAPNWKGWSQAGTVQFSARARPEYLAGRGRPFNAITTAGTKPFHQVVETGPAGGVGGVVRQFKGLTPGHTYRVTLRVAAEELAAGGAVSVHACAHAGAALTAAQLAQTDRAGVVSGTQSIVAGAGFVTETLELTLPSGVRNLTVWIRCQAGGPARVASDWLSLEDRTR